MLCDERLQLADQLRVPSELELGVDSLLDYTQAQLLETGDLALGEGVVGEVGQGPAAPECERLGERIRGRLRVFAVRLGGKPLEAGEVEFVGLDAEQVAGAACLQPLRGEQLAQVGDVDLERRPRRLRGVLAPESVDQCVAGDDLVRMQEEDRKQGALFTAAEGQWAVALTHFQGAEQAKVERARQQRSPFLEITVPRLFA